MPVSWISCADFSRTGKMVIDFLLRHSGWTLAGIIVFGGGCRLLRFHQELFLSRDGYAYVEAAAMIGHPGGWQLVLEKAAFSDMPPGFLWLLHNGIVCGFDGVLTGMFYEFVFSLILIGGIYWCLIGFYQKKSYALLGALLVATDPTLIRLGATILRDSPYCACFTVAVGAGAWAIQNRKYRYWGGFIAAAAAAILLRKEGVELLLILTIWFAWASIKSLLTHHFKQLQFAILSYLISVIGVLVITLPIQFYFQIHYQSQWQVIPLKRLLWLCEVFVSQIW